MTDEIADLIPFWTSQVMRKESLLFIAESEREPATATLLFPPDRIAMLGSADGVAVYTEGEDYTVDQPAGRLYLTPRSRIPQVTRGALYPSADPDGAGFMHVRGDPATFMLCAEGAVFHQQQTVVTYAHAPSVWSGYVPEYAGGALPRTLDRLHRRAPLTVCVAGDSISEGYNASGFVGASPAQPPYATLVAAGLEQVYRSPVTLHNFAQAGSASDAAVYTADRIADAQPQLVIVAFGMNDAGYMDADEFGANIRALMAFIRRTAPATEFVLVSSMLPHPDWHYTVMERFPAYREALASLCGAGVVLADMTSLWRDVLTRKSVYDLTGNGINHPNDFGHRLYAQVILALLVDAWDRDPASRPSGAPART